MSIEEINRRLDDAIKNGTQSDVDYWRGYLDAATALLRTHQNAQPNEPLTLEALKEMDGQPVVVVKGNDDPMWALLTVTPHNAEFVEFSVYCADGDKLRFDTDGDNNFDGEEVVFYLRPPKEA